jgi:hypothetical protein
VEEEVIRLRPSDRAEGAKILGAVSPGGGVEFRRHTLLPLDDCLYAVQATISRLTRSSLHRCLQRHGVSRLPEVEGDKTATKASSKLRAHLRNFVDAYNFARSLKTLKGLTPYQFICKCGTSDPKRFNLDHAIKCRDQTSVRSWRPASPPSSLGFTNDAKAALSR